MIRRWPLSTQIAAGVAAGLAVGVFAGPDAAIFQVVADAYVRLLQVTVLPYVTVSIIGGLGALSVAQAATLGKRVGVILLCVWVLTLALVFLFPLMFPPRQSASFFSPALLDEREAFDFLGLYIPTNPFYSLANNIVPAVVLFSILLGVALIGVPDKARLLDVLATVSRAVSAATNFVVALTPIGVFALAAVVSGTLDFDVLQRLEAYVVGYVGIAMLLSLWVLPGLVATLTPVPYRELMARTRNALIMAFMTTSLFAVLPLLTEAAKELVEKYGGGDANAGAEIDVIVPASFNFPHAGKVLSLSFLLFAAWFADVRVSLADYPRLAGVGLLTMFGSVNAAIPMLLDSFRIPSDTFALFMASGVVNARFGTLVAAVHTVTIAVIGACAVSGMLTIDRRKIARFTVVTVILTAAVAGGTRVFLAATLNQEYGADQLLTRMRPLRDRGTAQVFATLDAAPPLPPVVTSVLDRVRARGALRVAYFEDSLPYAFVNADGRLVGFDVEMAQQFARDLAVNLELVPMSRASLDGGLDASRCDVAMSGIAMTTDREDRVRYSASYLDETLAFIVPDHQTAAFSDWANVRAMGPIRIAVPRSTYYMQKVADELPGAEIVPIDSIHAMFGPQALNVRAFVATAERGSAYTLLHPEFAVAVPKPRPLKVPLAYVIAGRDQAMASMVDRWIELKQKDGTIDELFVHWIRGIDSTPRKPRWSVMRDVLGWRR